MTMTHTVAKAMAMDSADLIAFAKSGALSKAELYETIDRIAQRGRRDGESTQQAFSRYATIDPIGKQLLNEHMRKCGVPYASVAKTGGEQILERVRKLMKNSTEGESDVDALCRIANDLQSQNPKMTRSAALDAAMKSEEGRAAYQAGRAQRLAR
jgi:hypothetical protein